MKKYYTITVNAVDVDDIRGEISHFIDVYTAHTDAIVKNIAKAMYNIYSDEHPDRDVISIKVEHDEHHTEFFTSFD